MRKLLFFVLTLLSALAWADPSLKITISNNQLGLNQTATVTFTFSEGVTGFTTADIHITPAAAASVQGTVTAVSTSVYTVGIRKDNLTAAAINVDNNSYTALADGATGHGANLGINPSPIYYMDSGAVFTSRKVLADPQPRCLMYGEKLVVTATGVAAPKAVERFYIRKPSINSKAFSFQPIPQECLLRPSAGQSIVADPAPKASDAASPHGVHHHGSLMPKITKQFPQRTTGTKDIRIWVGNHDCTRNPDGSPISGGHCDPSGAERFAFLPAFMDNVDPIVYPGVKGTSHLHMFFGNAGINEHTNQATLIRNCTSTAMGGAANCVGYWSPAMIDMSTQSPIPASSVQVYYKTANNGIRYTEPLPRGLKIIAGNIAGNSPETSGAGYRCMNRSNNNVLGPFNYIPSCTYPTYTTVEFIVAFPTCVADDGNGGMVLDSPDHASHLVKQHNPSIPLYPNTGTTQFGSNHPVTGTPVGRNWCPTSHPHLITGIEQFATYEIQPGADTGTWRLSSDNYSFAQPGGFSGHADWWNGWNETIQSKWHENCNKSPLDCGTGYIGLSDGIGISSISVSGSVATITTSVPHRLRTTMLSVNGAPFTLKGRISGITGTESEKFNFNPADPLVLRPYNDMYEGPQTKIVSVGSQPLTILNATQIQYTLNSAPSGDGVTAGLNLTNAKIQWGEVLCNLDHFCPSEYYKQYYPVD